MRGRNVPSEAVAAGPQSQAAFRLSMALPTGYVLKISQYFILGSNWWGNLTLIYKQGPQSGCQVVFHHLLLFGPVRGAFLRLPDLRRVPRFILHHRWWPPVGYFQCGNYLYLINEQQRLFLLQYYAVRYLAYWNKTFTNAHLRYFMDYSTGVMDMQSLCDISRRVSHTNEPSMRISTTKCDYLM